MLSPEMVRRQGWLEGGLPNCLEVKIGECFMVHGCGVMVIEER